MYPATHEDALAAAALMKAYLLDDQAGIRALLDDSDPAALLSATVAVAAGLLTPTPKAIPAAVAALDAVTARIIDRCTTTDRKDSTDE